MVQIEYILAVTWDPFEARLRGQALNEGGTVSPVAAVAALTASHALFRSR